MTVTGLVDSADEQIKNTEKCDKKNFYEKHKFEKGLTDRIALRLQLRYDLSSLFQEKYCKVV